MPLKLEHLLAGTDIPDMCHPGRNKLSEINCNPVAQLKFKRQIEVKRNIHISSSSCQNSSGVIIFHTENSILTTTHSSNACICPDIPHLYSTVMWCCKYTLSWEHTNRANLFYVVTWRCSVVIQGLQRNNEMKFELFIKSSPVHHGPSIPPKA